jgi:SAM-dependent methyltransferase
MNFIKTSSLISKIKILYRKLLIYPALRRKNKLLSTKQVFTDIYLSNLWGGNKGEFCSGDGSVNKYTSTYIEVVKDFIIDKQIKTVIDLGCGDFKVGAKIQLDKINYIGIDIVEVLIEENCRKFANEQTKFLCLDIIKDILPEGDLCLIRQVLQHLSNDQILSILSSVRKYRYVIISEHYPALNDSVIFNLDKPHGLDTRVVDNSAVYLDSPPFNVANLSKILEVDLDSSSYPAKKLGEKIISFLIDNS